ncbi:hypothetical protein DL96DRAFT_1621910 [Flagelloscypha sp. PMI_526]|nr:hypothetical protein DL96DRAFT_1621910 [Flagelloscypha sp. PMI_526]
MVIARSVPVLLPAREMSVLISVEFTRQAGAYALEFFTWCHVVQVLLGMWAQICVSWVYDDTMQKRRFGQGSILYFLNRYFVVINLTMSVLAMLVAPSPKVAANFSPDFLHS